MISHFLVTSPQNPIQHPTSPTLSFASMRMLPYQPTLSCPSVPASPYAGAFHRTKGFCHGSLLVHPLVGGLVSGSTGWSSQPMCSSCGVTNSFCSSSPFIAPPWGPWAQADGWLQVSISPLVSCWPDLPKSRHSRFLLSSTSWSQQQCRVWCLQTGWIPRWGSPRWAFLWSLLHFCSFSSFGQGHFWVKNVEMGRKL